MKHTQTVITAILLAVSTQAMATNPPKTTVVDPVATSNQTQSGTNKQGQQQEQSQTGGTQTITNNPFITVGGASAEGGQGGNVSLGQVSPSSGVGDVLATGTIGGGNNTGGAGGQGGAGGNGFGGAGGSAKIAPLNSFNTSISENTYHDRDIHMASLVLSECSGSISGATDKNQHRFFGLAFTVRNKDCNAIRNAMAVDGMFADKEWAREILCARDWFKNADGRKVEPLCHANKSNKTASNHLNDGIRLVNWWLVDER